MNYFNVANPGAYFAQLVTTALTLFIQLSFSVFLNACMHVCTLYIDTSSFAWTERAIFLIGPVLEFFNNLWGLETEQEQGCLTGLQNTQAGGSVRQLGSYRTLFQAYRARICKRLRSPGIDSEKSTPPAYVAWAGTTNRVVVPIRQVKKHQQGRRQRFGLTLFSL